jgi:hypothetical protein
MEKGNLNAFFEGHLNYEVQGNSVVPAAVIGVRSMLWNDYRNY